MIAKILSIVLFSIFAAEMAYGQSFLKDFKAYFNTEKSNYQEQETDLTVTAESNEKFQRKIDSLRLIYQNPDFPVKNRISAQMRIVSSTLYKDPRNSLPEVQKYLAISKENSKQFPVNLAHAYSCMGLYHQKLENFDSARFYYRKEYDFAVERGLKAYILFAKTDLALVDEKEGKYDTALKIYLEVAEQALSENKANAEARARMNAGMLLILKSDYLAALEQLQKAKELCQTKKLNGFKASANMALGDLYAAIGEYSTANDYYDLSLKCSDQMNNSNTKRLGLIQYIQLKKKTAEFEDAIAFGRMLLNYEEKISIPNLKAESLTLMADLFHAANNADSSKFYIIEAINLYAKSDSKEKLYQTYSLAGLIYQKGGDQISAKKYCELSYSLNKDKGSSEQQKNNCFCLYQVYKSQNNHQLALRYHEEYLSSMDKLYDQDKAKEIVKVQLNERFKNKTAQDSINNQHRLGLLKLEHQQKTAKQIRLASGLGIGLLISLGIAFILWYAFRINKKQKEELQRLNTLNKQIFSIISHDFRGPLMSMNFMVETLGKTNMDEHRMRLYLNDIKNQISQTSNILDNLLNWAKSELQINLQEKYRTGLQALVQEMQQVFAAKLAEKSLSLDISISKEVELNIHPDLLRIVLRNLLSNAIKYSLPEQKILIAYNNSNQIVIEDHGLGMDESQKEQLFKQPVFSQMGTEQETGFGIGLYITSELLKRIGWKISFISEKDKGSSFFVHSPK